MLLENTRFDAGDTSNSDEFGQALARFGDIFVNDAFGTCHRDQGSITAVTKFVSRSYPGLLVRQEVQYLRQHLSDPVRYVTEILALTVRTDNA
jgi:phosphoglycerate kinase